MLRQAIGAVGRFTNLVDLPDINELRKKLGSSKAAPPVGPRAGPSHAPARGLACFSGLRRGAGASLSCGRGGR
jgi:hypothetical protein